MQTIEGIIEDITFFSDESGFMVFTLATNDDYVTCVGTMPEVAVGEKIELSGNYTSHPVYGDQFKVASFTLKVPTTLEDITSYLSSGIIYGVGPATAKRIVDKFGEETLYVLENSPEQIATIKGIGKKRAPLICESFHEHMASREIMLQLTHLGVSANQALKLYKEYGNNAVSVLKTNPYQIIEDIAGIGFKTADAIARDIGISKDSIFRLKSGMGFVLNWASQNGHDYLPKAELISKSAVILEVNPDSITNVLNSMIADGIAIDYKDCIYLPSLYFAEMECAKRLVNLCNFGKVIEEAEEDLEKAIPDFSIQMSEEQRRAILQAIKYPCSIITGGPGTGKTTIIELAISIFEKRDMSVFLCAPTGRAAKRMSEATGYEASTIHRLLEFSGEGFFQKNEDNPIETDVLIIDEMSMVDMDLMYKLIQAIPNGTKLIMIGDADQLMSVGAGNVLNEMVNSKEIPTTKLTKIYRQGEGSLIVENAHRINHGEQPYVEKGADFDFVEINSVREILSKLKQYFMVMRKRVTKLELYDIQVLSPTKKGDLGVPALNIALQDIINPGNTKEYKRGDVIFRIDDKVMQIKNNYNIEWRDKKGNSDLGVFNGDMGIISDMDFDDESLDVLFDDDRTVRYPFNELDQLNHAYCMSVHKSQGSEFDTVLLLLNGPAPLMTRNLLYTAVTRAKKKLYLLGDMFTMMRMINNNHINERYTNLANFIIENQELLNG